MLIPLHELIQKHKFKPKGVVHIGASYGQEAEAYIAAGVQHVLWIEPIPEIFNELRKRMVKFIPNFESIIIIPELLSDEDNKTVDFHIASNEGQSSSMLDFALHSKMHPTVRYTRTIKLTTSRFDTLVNESMKEIDLNNYDFLNIDVQGAELMVLRGMGDTINYFTHAYIEVNEAELYKGCPLLADIDRYMLRYNFDRVDLKMTNWKWGDAFYKKIIQH